jgi:hydrogenase nickel incorporation protein HypA/HybF
MHEMGIALRIAEIARSAIPADRSDAQVEAVSLKVGRLIAVVPESLRFCFEVITEDTPLAGARLEIEDVPVIGRCRSCDARSRIDEPPFICAACGDGRLELVSGRELLVQSIELADEAVE